MKRTVISLAFIVAAIGAVVANSQGDSQFVQLHGMRTNDALMKLRKECGDLGHVVTELDRRVGDQDGDHETYAEALGDVLEHFKTEGLIPDGCIRVAYHRETYDLFGPEEAAGMVLLSTSGDIVIGYAGHATSSWMEVSPQWGADIMLDDNGVEFAIVLPNGDRRWTSTWDGMRDLAKSETQSNPG